MKTKKCTQCGKVLPATTEYFNKCSKVKSGLYAKCKKCRKINSVNNKKYIQEYHKKYYKENKERLDKNNKRNYEVNKERILKKNKEYREKNKERIQEYRKIYRELNKDILREHEREYYRANKEKIAIKQREYYFKNKERISEYNKSWRIKNLDHRKEYQRKYREKNAQRLKLYKIENREHIRIVQREYRKNNPEVKRISEHKRNALKRNLPNTLTLKQWMDIKQCFNNKCAYCGKTDNSGLTQDHFIPLSRGGEYTVNNIIPACKSCNSSKGNKDFFEWYEVQSFYDEKRKLKIIKHLNIEGNVQQLKLI